jgi:hypothetical protein
MSYNYGSDSDGSSGCEGCAGFGLVGLALVALTVFAGISKIDGCDSRLSRELGITETPKVEYIDQETPQRDDSYEKK